MLKKTIPILLLSILFSCEKSTSFIETNFEIEFKESVKKLNGKLVKIHNFPDWKADVYFLDSKPRMFFHQTMPENGFTSKRVYINADNVTIDKIIYRTCLPDFTRNDHNYELIDSIFEIYPRNGFMIRYVNDHRIDTISNIIRINKIVNEVNSIKDDFEQNNIK